MTGLLVSVRSAAEARLACALGVDLLDVKEPGRGSLGRAEPVVWREIAALGATQPLSLALGELRDWDAQRSHEIPPGYAFAKLGLSGLADDGAWEARWRRAIARWPPGLSPVAVIYADALDAQAPPAARILPAAGAVGCRAVLVDTFVKGSRRLLDCWTLDELARLVDETRRRGMLAVVAGSLDAAQLAHVLPLGPDYVAVRGAACAGGREAGLSAAPLLTLVQTVRGVARAAGSPSGLDGRPPLRSRAGEIA